MFGIKPCESRPPGRSVRAIDHDGPFSWLWALLKPEIGNKRGIEHVHEF